MENAQILKENSVVSFFTFFYFHNFPIFFNKEDLWRHLDVGPTRPARFKERLLLRVRAAKTLCGTHVLTAAEPTREAGRWEG